MKQAPSLFSGPKLCYIKLGTTCCLSIMFHILFHVRNVHVGYVHPMWDMSIQCGICPSNVGYVHPMWDMSIQCGICPSNVGYVHPMWDMSIQCGICPSNVGYVHPMWDMSIQCGICPSNVGYAHPMCANIKHIMGITM